MIKEVRFIIKTRVTELLGIKYPILCGQMRNVTNAKLVAAVSNAGGLGMYGGYHNAKELLEEVKKVKSMTDKPFAVSINVVFTRDPQELKRVYDEELTPVLKEGIDVFETVGRVPEPFIKIIKETGVKWLHRCARVRDASTAERIGVQAVTIIGYEAAGLVGAEDVTTMVRVPAAVDAVKIPVIAAGGIADGRGFAAALALGAEGVLMATRFMCTKESLLHHAAKKLMIETPENNLTFLLKDPLRRERVINTEYTQKIHKMQGEGKTTDELEHLTGRVECNRAFVDGEIGEGPMHASQATGLIHDEPTCAELIERIISEAKVIGQRLRNFEVFK